MNEIEEKIWNTIVNCDSQFDGVFYYGVITTGIYCRPSCKSKTPNKGNVKIYNTTEQAKEDGLRPCKRCRPDTNVKDSPSEISVLHAKDLLENHYIEDWTLEELSERVYSSPFWLQRRFKEMVGMSPSRYLTKLRIASAKQLLLSTDLTIITIALQTGFKNSSHFSSVFTKQTGMPPSTFRSIMRQQ
ncbi:AraC family transcriptional regulator of adaptative response / methylphosphotriester-DNA alkyltransferase methyltransferase [Peribacillus deserti]|uniref:AraC family transcriptional regulator of adaptative response / methylphosphotriester-DNA alkyltransferase methyltransferase n=1 Tax=Peribacillus deserti TaxID=673318 RepID=A0ABS2QDQ7_9BACI|nr:AraC family transcriptional regulator of adaptative response / methylphosphotriester-DNA alkyltransferase methyltransferase [Peribacillus deserti]